MTVTDNFLTLLNRLSVLNFSYANLYRIMTINSVKRLIKSDTLKSGTMSNKINDNFYISFTRDQNYLGIIGSGNTYTFQLVFDKNKLSENYKILPYSALGFGRNESEEIIKSPIKNIHKYILEIRQIDNCYDIEIIKLIKQYCQQYTITTNAHLSGLKRKTKTYFLYDSINNTILSKLGNNDYDWINVANIKKINGYSYQRAYELNKDTDYQICSYNELKRLIKDEEEGE